VRGARYERGKKGREEKRRGGGEKKKKRMHLTQVPLKTALFSDQPDTVATGLWREGGGRKGEKRRGKAVSRLAAGLVLARVRRREKGEKGKTL